MFHHVLGPTDGAWGIFQAEEVVQNCCVWVLCSGSANPADPLSRIRDCNTMASCVQVAHDSYGQWWYSLYPFQDFFCPCSSSLGRGGWTAAAGPLPLRVCFDWFLLFANCF